VVEVDGYIPVVEWVNVVATTLDEDKKLDYVEIEL
jgi:hypothetical protein